MNDKYINAREDDNLQMVFDHEQEYENIEHEKPCNVIKVGKKIIV